MSSTPLLGESDNLRNQIDAIGHVDSPVPPSNAGSAKAATNVVNFTAYSLPSDNNKQVYAVFPVGRKYPVSGACSLKVLHGSVRILGYTATPSDASLDIFAPLSCNQYLIEAEAGISEAEIGQQLPFLTDSVKCLNQSHLFAVVILSKVEQSTSVYGVASHFASAEGRHLNPALLNSCSYPPAVKLIFEITGAMIGGEDRPAVDFWPQLANSFNAIVQRSVALDLETNTSSSSPVVIMVCGEKNAGKSTVCRAIINSLLSQPVFREKGVAFFECDVGQTEFTPSGTIAWSLIKHPLLEPPFMHMKCGAEPNDEPNFYAVFYGDLSPGQSPNRYYECLKSVYSRIPPSARNVPLVVNTMGWLKSLGLALLVDTYRLFQPDIVLHLRTAQDVSPQLTPGFFFAADGINSPPPGNGVPGTRLPQHELLEVPVQRKVPTGKVLYQSSNSAPPPFFLRALSTVGHLAMSKDVVLSASLKSLPKCELPLSGDTRYMFAGICHERVPATETARVLLGSLVALCHIDVRLPANFSPPTFLLTLPSGWIGNEWLGLGVVTAIDEVSRKMTLATPLAEHPQVLAQVNCVLLGTVTITQSALAEIVPEYARQGTAQPDLQVNQSERDDESIPLDAQRFGGRRDFMRRKRVAQTGQQSLNNNDSIDPSSNNF